MSAGIVTESGIAFDFSKAKSFRKHDAVNTFWPGVDFEIELFDGPFIWLEVKNWEPSDLSPQRRGGQRWSFLCKMRSKSFFTAMREKFLGTSCYLGLTQNHPQTDILYIVLLESPRLSPALLSHTTTRMRGLIPAQGGKTTKWQVGIQVAVMTVAEWNRRFPEYPARIV